MNRIVDNEEGKKKPTSIVEFWPLEQICYAYNRIGRRSVREVVRLMVEIFSEINIVTTPVVRCNSFL